MIDNNFNQFWSEIFQRNFLKARFSCFSFSSRFSISYCVVKKKPGEFTVVCLSSTFFLYIYVCVRAWKLNFSWRIIYNTSFGEHSSRATTNNNANPAELVKVNWRERKKRESHLCGSVHQMPFIVYKQIYGWIWDT